MEYEDEIQQTVQLENKEKAGGMVKSGKTEVITVI